MKKLALLFISALVIGCTAPEIKTDVSSQDKSTVVYKGILVNDNPSSPNGTIIISKNPNNDCYISGKSRMENFSITFKSDVPNGQMLYQSDSGGMVYFYVNRTITKDTIYGEWKNQKQQWTGTYKAVRQ